MSKRYDWDLIERLLHHVQNSVAIEDASDTHAAELRALLLERGFIAAHTSGAGGSGEGATLTANGASLLAMIDSSIPGNDIRVRCWMSRPMHWIRPLLTKWPPRRKSPDPESVLIRTLFSCSCSNSNP